MHNDKYRIDECRVEGDMVRYTGGGGFRVKDAGVRGARVER